MRIDPTTVRRFRPVAWLGACFLAATTLTRLVLLWATGPGIPADGGAWAAIFGIGLGYDLLAFTYFATPLVLLLWLVPGKGRLTRPGQALVATLLFVQLYAIAFVAVAEWTFWEEFQTRFNFIAVDYLVYTNEVIGNIRESYPMGTILFVLTALVVVAFASGRRWRAPLADGSTWRGRSLVAGAWMAVVVAGTFAISGELKDRGRNQYADELAGNGLYQFFAAYRTAGIDYDRFYRTLPLRAAFVRLRRKLQAADASFVSADPLDIRRDIHNAAPERRLNVVLISVESLSASFSGTYGRADSLTPELDKLSADSLVFEQLYASGTRTVRGLEALALSVPPTPGASIVRRPHNERLFSLASVFNAKGYASEFLYGGYGAFDDMNRFFGGNGYAVYDRSAIDAASVHHANVWGVADEDLYTLALARFDADAARGQPFFAHVMTTSNHRPYTFPEGRVAMPQGERSSAVAYTDWAIGDFLRRARTRPWFADTVFVITADHCAASGGLAQLPVFRYHIPMWIHSPGNISPGRITRRVAQIDIGPTVLGLLGMDYRSSFYGQDVFNAGPGHERAFIGNYQRLGYLQGDTLVALSPHRRIDTVQPDYRKDAAQVPIAQDEALALDAIAYYQTASHRFSHGLMAAADVAPDAAAPATRTGTVAHMPEGAAAWRPD